MSAGGRGMRCQDWIALIVLASLSFVATWSIWKGIAQYAIGSAEQSHVLIAPVVILWLAWLRRERLRRWAPRWTYAGSALVLVGWFVAWLGFTRSLLVVQQFGAILLVVTAALTVLGWEFFRRLAPSIVAMCFLLPIPGYVRQEISVPLQQITAYITAFVLDIVGFPVTRAGTILVINGQEVAVAEACNGMRMVSSLAIVSYAFVFSVPMRQWVRVFILLVSPLVAVACNVLRVVPSTLLYGYADHNLASLFHDLSGWAMLFVALGALWLMLATLRWIDISVTPCAVVEH